MSSIQADLNATVNVDVNAGAVAEDTLMNAKIVPIMPPGLPVIFSFNPKSIKFSRSANTTNNANSTNGPRDATVKQTQARTVTFTAYLEGPQTQTMGSILQDMMLPFGGKLGALVAMAAKALGVNITKPPHLMFIWGSLTMDVIMTRCDLNYTRFHLMSGMPLRAEAALVLQEKMTLFDQLTNPTSGGLPGREERVVNAQENLVTIATSSYGGPAYWRQIAETNKVDDPFRVKPGSVLYLPSPTELRRPN
jgi:nucleoid-associated protein YgaU